MTHAGSSVVAATCSMATPLCPSITSANSATTPYVVSCREVGSCAEQLAIQSGSPVTSLFVLAPSVSFLCRSLSSSATRNRERRRVARARQAEK